MGRSRIRKEKSDTHVISNIRTRCLSVRKDKLTTLDTKRHALYHSVCGVGLTVSGGYQIILRSFLTGSITLTCFLSVLIFAVGNFVVIAIRFRETTIRFRNFDFEEDKNNEALILQSERREIWNLIVSGVLLLTEIILSLAIYARIIDFGDDIRRQELVVLGEQIAYFFPCCENRKALIKPPIVSI
ncbi:unnamed protein product [Oikopleura dioica]|uniref:Uncharacterized protein n=1 Tax=Oikopleura dioica TaxID=34765 RepID=E4XE65_OIKDI|nr:unnamed protein product [Oikopleura dioica]